MDASNAVSTPGSGSMAKVWCDGVVALECLHHFQANTEILEVVMDGHSPQAKRHMYKNAKIVWLCSTLFPPTRQQTVPMSLPLVIITWVGVSRGLLGTFINHSDHSKEGFYKLTKL